jgi:hypothetical protein
MLRRADDVGRKRRLQLARGGEVFLLIQRRRAIALVLARAI